jgi:RNA-directed DNA polymerase
MINWDTVERQVKQLQMRIAKATREKRYGRVKALQWLLTHSHYAKLLAVKRVTQNQGAKTPGVDNVTWKYPAHKFNAIASLKRRGYTALPLRRIYIPKKNGKKTRPLGIPAMKDRAMQALYLLALEPVAETLADKNSYGFRPHRSCADAIEQCFVALNKRTSAQWVCEGDIKSCFDKISHQWLLNNIPIDKLVLAAWLKSGYIEQRQLFATEDGTPQGGIISPTLLVITLSGLEAKIKAATRQPDKVNVVIYADDFIVTGVSPHALQDKVIPVITEFLRERGLELSAEKTKITDIYTGFDFLGFNIRKYKHKLLIKPAKESVKSFLADIRQATKTNVSNKTTNLINLLNPKIRGWAYYYRHVVSKATFSKVDSEIFKVIWDWAHRRHAHKSATWIRKKYYCRVEYDNWVFNAGAQPAKGRYKLLTLLKAQTIKIVRHVKIIGLANPYDPLYAEYFQKRLIRNKFSKVAGSDTGLIKA